MKRVRAAASGRSVIGDPLGSGSMRSGRRSPSKAAGAPTVTSNAGSRATSRAIARFTPTVYEWPMVRMRSGRPDAAVSVMTRRRPSQRAARREHVRIDRGGLDREQHVLLLAHLVVLHTLQLAVANDPRGVAKAIDEVLPRLGVIVAKSAGGLAAHFDENNRTIALEDLLHPVQRL